MSSQAVPPQNINTLHLIGFDVRNLEFLTRMPNTKTLILMDCTYTFDHRHLVHISRLTVSRYKKAIGTLEDLPNLESLKLEMYIGPMPTYLGRLISLELIICPNIKTFPEGTTSLEFLNLLNMFQYEDPMANAPNVDVRNVDTIDASSMHGAHPFIPDHLPKLTGLSIAFSQTTRFPTHMPKLRQLMVFSPHKELDWTKLETQTLPDMRILSVDASDTFTSVPRNMPNLSDLYVQSCKSFTRCEYVPKSVIRIHIDRLPTFTGFYNVHLPKLRELDVHRCPLVTSVDQLPTSDERLNVFRVDGLLVGDYNDYISLHPFKRHLRRGGSYTGPKEMGDESILRHISSFTYTMKWPVQPKT